MESDRLTGLSLMSQGAETSFSRSCWNRKCG